MDGIKSFEGSFISAMTVTNAWLPAYAKAILSTDVNPSAKDGFPTRTISLSQPGGARLGSATPSEIMTIRTAANIEMVQNTNNCKS